MPMPELPSHPDGGPALPQARIAGTFRLRKVLLAAAVVGLVVLVAVLHLTGVVGGGSH